MSVGRLVWADLRGKGSGAPNVARVTDLFSIVMELQYKGMDRENKGAVSRGWGDPQHAIHAIGGGSLSSRVE